MPGFEAIVVWAWVNFYNIGQICLIAISSFDYNLMHDLIVLGLRCVKQFHVLHLLLELCKICAKIGTF